MTTWTTAKASAAVANQAFIAIVDEKTAVTMSVYVWATSPTGTAGDYDLSPDAVPPESLSQLVALVEARTVNAGNARVVLDKLVADGGDPAEIVEREDLGAMGDSGELAGIVAKVIDDNPDVVERIRGGNAKAMGALVGPIMRETKGKADGGEVNRLIREQLGV